MARIDELRKKHDEYTAKGIVNLNKDEMKEFSEVYLEMAKLLKNIVFVYGSLRRGQYNNRMIERDPNNGYIGNGCIKGYRLFSLGSYPAIVYTGDEKDVVYGELFEIEDSTSDMIDNMELGAAYHIVSLDVKHLDSDEITVAKGYAMSMQQMEHYRGEVIESGDWALFNSLPKPTTEGETK